MGPDKLTKKEKSVITREAVIFAFFLLLSFVLWYLKSLEKEIEGDIRFPVRFINVPRQKAISSDGVKLNFYLKGPGYSLLKLKMSGRKAPVVIDISKINYKRVPESKSPDYYIVTSGLIKSFTVQLRSECEITSIKPDTLFFTIEKASNQTSRKPNGEKVPNENEQASSK